MLNQLRLFHYKGFEDYRVGFPASAVLVGPNNAGKSTVVSALRLCSYLVSVARRAKPSISIIDQTRDRRVAAYPARLPTERFVTENVRHEFRELETRLELYFKNRAALYAVWPVGDAPYFYFEHVPGAQPNDRICLQVAKDWLPAIGGIPTLTPVAQSERLLTKKYLEASVDTRLASAHFRNQLNYIRQYGSDDEFQLLIEFLLEHTPEISTLDLQVSYDRAGGSVDLFFEEAGRRTPKELVWVGDGLQIWLQLLFHLWRNRKQDVLLLDEPDVFLHPDLQRRLVRVVKTVPVKQIAMASHLRK